jgi:hypothetical protein
MSGGGGWRSGAGGSETMPPRVGSGLRAYRACLIWAKKKPSVQARRVQVHVFDMLGPVHQPGLWDAKSLLSLGSCRTLWNFVSLEPGRGRAPFRFVSPPSPSRFSR